MTEELGNNYYKSGWQPSIEFDEATGKGEVTYVGTDPNYKNFTLDGQIIPLEDYLEVKPEREDEIKKYIKEKRISIGPMYVLPDEFLVSGESLIRNFMVGHQIARKFGNIMKAGYIPDTFGHIAQLPQILSGFEIPSFLFARGFGNEFEENNLNMEFIWNAPGNAASILSIHLIAGYGSVAELNMKTRGGQFKMALKKINRIVSKLEDYTATPYLLLNSGSDHHDARPEIPSIVKQWNELFPEKYMEQNDFEYYINKILETEQKLNSFQGELRGGKYNNLLSGVFSARMWIKQRNTKIEYLFEKYTEPISAITMVLDKSQKFNYPYSYIQNGLKWLIKNHPHDSICGCSIDQVHNEMKTRFDWAEQIGIEVFNHSFMYLSGLINFKPQENNRITLIIFNPLPWKRKDIVIFNAISKANNLQQKFPKDFKLTDSDNNEIVYQDYPIQGEPRFSREIDISYQFSFLAKVPACGYKVYYIYLEETAKKAIINENNFILGENSVENEFYKVEVKNDGQINILDKKRNIWFEKVCQFEDVADWGDEYDYSGPTRNQVDKKYTTDDAKIVELIPFLNGPSQKSIKIKMILNLPVSLTPDRLKREKNLFENVITLYVSLYKGINRIDFKIDLENKSKDHRIRVLFPSKIISDKVFCDGHFYIVPRNITIPNGKKWRQKPSKTSHQKDFIALHDESKSFSILNRGLPEYEAIKNEEGTITVAITLLRSIGWLSRTNLDSRRNDAGPSLKTPGAQCIGNYSFELSLVVEDYKRYWFDSEVHIKGKEFNCPLKPIFPLMLSSTLKHPELLMLTRMGLLTDSNKVLDKGIVPCLPSELSFLEIENKNIMLSALKKSEKGDCLIIRIYNISSFLQKTNLTFYKDISIQKAEIVNFLEERPKNEIKAKINKFYQNELIITMEPYIIATIKLEFNFLR